MENSEVTLLSCLFSSVYLLSALTGGFASAATHFVPQPLHATPPAVTIITPSSDPQAKAIPEEFRHRAPQPLMRGEGFNYDLYYSYRLTPHIIVGPNLQQTTKPGNVENNAQHFVGGISAGIHF